MLTLVLTACASKAPAARDPSPEQRGYLHSPELNAIMKSEINKPFSQLTFYVFHAAGDLDYDEIGRTTDGFHAGIKRVKAFPNPPVTSDQGREVFTTFLDSLEGDCFKLANAIKTKNTREMQSMLGRISRTCNNCHHFFRLDITDSPEFGVAP